MAARKRTQEEKNLKTLRELAALPANKQCFDCHQRGPTYVNVTIGSFVCTSCSGILRGLNPPHRVKSITMTTFTPEEIELIKNRGNEYCRYVWLGNYESRSVLESESRDEQRIRDLMIQKYERKRWYVDPDIALRRMQLEHQQSGQQIQPAHHSHPATPVSSMPETKPLSSLLGKNSLPLVINKSQSVSSNSSWPPPVTSANTSVMSPPVQPPSKSSVDLFSAFGSDPFSISAPTRPNLPAVPASSSANANFANFESAFNSTAPSTETTPVSNILVDNNNFGAFASQPFPTPSSEVTSPISVPATNDSSSKGPAPPSADRYAALADLDSLFHKTTSPASSATPTWPNSSTAPSSSFTTPVSSAAATGFGTVSSNPFTSTNSTWTQAMPQPGMFQPANPFDGGAKPPASTAVSHPGSFGQVGLDTTQAGVFGAPNIAASAGFSQFPLASATSPPNGLQPSAVQMQKMGGFAATPGVTSTGWTVPASNSWAGGVVSPGGPVMKVGQFSAWPQQQTVSPVANPFMANSMPRTNSSNPFL